MDITYSIVLPDFATIVRCSECNGLVAQYDQVAHTEWHVWLFKRITKT